MHTTFRLGWPVVFLNEKRTEPYVQYGEGVPQLKKLLGAKSSGGVSSSALEQADVAWRL